MLVNLINATYRNVAREPSAMLVLQAIGGLTRIYEITRLN